MDFHECAHTHKKNVFAHLRWFYMSGNGQDFTYGNLAKNKMMGLSQHMTTFLRYSQSLK